MIEPYNPSAVEKKWQQAWKKADVYTTDFAKAPPSSSGLRRAGKKPYFNLVMFPYPSGDKLHVGHWYNFAPADSNARYQRMKGYDVFSPMGFDAFGLPAENYAVKTGVPPAESITKNVETMITQLSRIGTMYDWNHMVNTSEPWYYKWTQWLFLQMHKNGLAYKKLGNVNFCPNCQTVLANEQAQDGTCERCGTAVIQKPLEQWFWKTTQYADKLLDNLDGLDWPEKTKIMQRNWIGRSEGAEITFAIEGAQRGVIGPMNWPSEGSGLTGGLNRRLTDDWKGRIHSPRCVHATFTPYKRGVAFEETPDSAKILRILRNVAERHDIALHEVCAMPDHVHALLSFDSHRHLERDVLKKLKGASAREFLKEMDDDGGRLWAEGSHFEDIDTLERFEVTLSYIQKNPENAKISDDQRLLSNITESITVFTTRPDTLFGCTYLVLAPEHPLVDAITIPKNAKEIAAYRKNMAGKNDMQRTELAKTKTGVPTGAFALHPVTGEKLPIWIADYVLMTYGTGAIMAVPGHDERDGEFANIFKLPVKEVVQVPSLTGGLNRRLNDIYTGEGIAINSDFLDGLKTAEAKKKMVAWLEKEEKGRGRITFRLRDWLVSRQRYWGAPIPIVYDPEGKAHPVPEEHLPWLLPTDVEFKPTGESPLRLSKEFVERTEKIFGKGWRPEYDTMDTFVCSSFYYLMYLNAPEHRSRLATGAKKKTKSKNDIAEPLVDPTLEKKWMPVSMYIGGPEHACMHLIYARFVMMALKDFGFVSKEEPFKKLVHQGLITNKGVKMSKSKGNVVSPDSFVDYHGSDAFRMYLMFMGPFTDGGDWSDTGIKGIDRFVQRIWKILSPIPETAKDDPTLDSLVHLTIKRVTDSMERLHFNTAISALMQFLNAVEVSSGVSRGTAKVFTRLLAPLAPHLAEELWQVLHVGEERALHGQTGFVIDEEWPSYDPKMLISDTMVIAVQVNGKLRGDVTVASKASKEEILALAKAHENVAKFIEGGIKKEIYVPGKLVSFVV